MGFTASQVDGDSYSGFDKPGIAAGVFIQRSLSSRLMANMEIRYAMRGAKNPPSDDHTGLYVLSLHYMDVPITIAVKVHKILSVEAGVIPGFLFASGARDDHGKIPEEALADLKKFDLGTSLGAAVYITPKLFLRIRYSYSFFSIRNLSSAGNSYSWFGKILGHSSGDFNNYFTTGLYYKIR